MIWNITSIWNALYGGLLIGLAVSILLIFIGKVAGISGILGQTLKLSFLGQGWRYSFLLGLIVSPITYGRFWLLPEIVISANSTSIIIAGFLVGLGTQLANGCTSGHGICGIARLSLRSFVATLTFMSFGIFTTYIIRHLI